VSGRRILLLVAAAFAAVTMCAAGAAADTADSTTAEGVGVADATTQVAGATVVVSEGIGVADGIGTTAGAATTVAEGVGVHDGFSGVTGVVETVTEGVGVHDAPTAKVVNMSPKLTLGGLAGNEGTAATGTGAFVDPDQNQWTITVDFGDGSAPQPVQYDAQKSFTLNHVYDDDGAYAVSVEIDDGVGGTDMQTAIATIEGVAPTAQLANNGPIDEGSNATISFSNQHDPSTADTNAGFTYAFACDGSTLSAPAASPSTACSFDDDGTHTVKARISDKDGDFTDYTTDVIVRGVAPTATLTNDGPVAEGSAVTISFSNQSDPSAADTAAGFSYRVACDGITFLPAPSATTTCVFDDGPSTHVVRGEISDKDGLATVYETTVVVNNAAPDGTLGNSGPVNEGSPATISWSGQSDPSQADTAAGFTYRYACDGQTLGAPTTSASATCTFDDGPSSHTVLARIIDKDGGSTDRTTDVSVANVAPTATFIVPTAATNEGSTFTLALQNASDPSQADTAAGFKLEYDCGNGAGYQSSATCTAIDNPSQAVKARIIDKDGGATEYTGTATVANVAPSVTITGPPSGTLVQVGQPITFTGTFRDPGTKDTHTARWSFDSITASGTVNESNGSGSTSLVTSFPDAGVYSVRLTVTDKDGAATTASTVNGLEALVVVYDPSAGFVTGGGWIDSPAGAYRGDPSAGGKATFGFVSKYQKGANVPTGNTEFHFSAAKFDFASTSYQWLVVAGSKAQYKGSGMVNGTGGYGFLLTAYDGSPDRLRLKVWDGAGAIVYDNALGSPDDIDTANPQALSGGSIIVHR
jgi:hypothetical protein